MDCIVLDQIPFGLDMSRLMNRLHVEPGSQAATELEDFAEQVQAIARPKAMYALATITDRDETGVAIEGIPFLSRVLRVNLEARHRVFPFVATCGTELDAWYLEQGPDDLLYSYWLDTIKEMALRSASQALSQHLDARHAPGTTSSMNPGSLSDWPLWQQRPLFELLADVTTEIGVTLTASCLMKPNKSVSGIRFASEESFASCQLCPRDECPGRRAPYEAALYDEKYRPVSS